MEEARNAWELWHMLQELSEILWRRYEREFMDYCMETCDQKRKPNLIQVDESDLPF